MIHLHGVLGIPWKPPPAFAVARRNSSTCFADVQKPLLVFKAASEASETTSAQGKPCWAMRNADKRGEGKCEITWSSHFVPRNQRAGMLYGCTLYMSSLKYDKPSQNCTVQVMFTFPQIFQPKGET